MLADVAPDLAAEERCGESHQEHRDNIERTLTEGSGRPSQDAELFTVLVASDGTGVVTITAPSGRDALLLVFTSPIRAADYADELLPHGGRPGFLVLTSGGLLSLLSQLRDMGIRLLTIDRCPRCNIFTSLEFDEAATPGTLISLWAITKSTELARSTLYLDYARKAATNGDLKLARQVAFEIIAHVSPDQTHAHLLLGEVGIALKDHHLIAEAETFLRFVGAEVLAAKLRNDARACTSDFMLSMF